MFDTESDVIGKSGTGGLVNLIQCAENRQTESGFLTPCKEEQRKDLFCGFCRLNMRF